MIIPEGPEVRRCAESLRSVILNVKITKLQLVSGKIARQGIPGPEFIPSIVKSVTPYGKMIVVQFESGQVLTSTLGMSGWWYPKSLTLLPKIVKYYEKNLSLNEFHDQVMKHSRVYMMSGNTILTFFTDPRNFGNMKLHDRLDRTHIGFDLLNEMTPLLEQGQTDFIEEILLGVKESCLGRFKRMKIGKLSLEQSIISGLGNIYRAETLWLSKINPHKTFEELTEEEWFRFCEIGCAVLNIAYQTHGHIVYSREFLMNCVNFEQEVTGHLVYGKIKDPFGNSVIADKTFGRTLYLSTLK